ncbi:DMT family transporter [Microvirga terricola]|uniref:DMT family transporter n=1 Tax=Microvirga terricola TaxID=2719797 RepID=A0ABX0VDI1_9HYPH|nr:DMT family transporter [Microvirga terricola]NIX77890.1 DMT family transporter [Microvirga terricola]
MNILHSLRKSLFGNAYLLLILTTLFWGGNGVAGRLAVGEISPMVLVALRWVVVVAITLPLVGRQLAAAWPVLKTKRWMIAAMGTCGFTAFNALFYGAAHYTSAVNLTIFQGAIPVLVLLGAVLFFGAKVRALQVLGMLVTMIGVVVVSSRGDWAVLRELALNFGDVLMLIACLFYAGYTLGLRQRPAVPGFVFFTALAFVAFLTSLPLVAVEMARGAAQWPTPKGWLVLLYVALLPSLLAQIFFIRGVELIGPARAGLFVNLVPVFGALLAVILLGEPFASYHAIGLAMVLGGIWLAERRA